MSRPTGRLLALIELLQGGGLRTAREIADRLGVDERTARRDIERLLELDIPVESVRGRHGGFRIAAGARLPPLMLDAEEAVAVVLGLGAVRRSGPSARVRTAAETAAAKLGRVLPTRVAGQVAGLAAVATTSDSDPVGPEVEASTDTLLTASRAAEEGRPLHVVHRRDGTTTTRTVLPYGVVEHHGRWYLVGLDSRSDEVRTFRLDRVERLEIGTGRFRRPETDPALLLTSSLASAPRRHRVEVEVHAPEERIRRLLPESIARLQALAEDPGWWCVTIEAERLDWVAGVLAQLDAPFRIRRPAELHDEVEGLARRLLAQLDVDG